MSRASRITLWLALPALLLAASALLPGSAKAVRKPAASKAQKQPPEVPPPPLPQELPPVAPTVTYRGGLLTIVAQNSTLLDILTAVRKATGAAVDAPPSLAGERVATRLGPAPPRDVLTALLNGSRFDYILLSTPDDPGGVRRLILRARCGEGSPAADSAVVAPAAVRPAPGARTLPPDTSEDDNAAPEQTVEPAEEAAPEPQPPQPQPPEVKSPEQLQEELRRQQEEQQQQQQQQEQPPQ